MTLLTKKFHQKVVTHFSKVEKQEWLSSPELAALSNKSDGSRYKKLWLLSAGIKGSRCAERWLSTCGTVAQLRSEYSIRR
jgi:hypothetical protein